MPASLTRRFELQKANAIADCIRCGRCVEVCPVIEHTPLGKQDPGEVQGELVNFLGGSGASETVQTRAFACMQCFRCAEGVCPVGLNPFRLNEAVKSESGAGGLADLPYTEPRSPPSKSWPASSCLAPNTRGCSLRRQRSE